MSCPHRVAMEHGVIPASEKNTKTPLDYIFKRQVNDKIPKVRNLLGKFSFEPITFFFFEKVAIRALKHSYLGEDEF